MDVANLFSLLHRSRRHANPTIIVYSAGRSQVAGMVSAHLAQLGQVESKQELAPSIFEDADNKTSFVIEVDPNETRTTNHEPSYKAAFQHLLDACQAGRRVCWYILGGQQSQEFHQALKALREQLDVESGIKPLEVANDSQMRYSIAQHLGPEPRKKHILVVSGGIDVGDFIFTDVLYSRLSSLGFDVTVLHSHRQAESYLRESPNKFDMVVTDLINKDENRANAGTKLLKVARETQPDAKCLLVSHHANDYLRKALAQVGLAADPDTNCLSLENVTPPEFWNPMDGMAHIPPTPLVNAIQEMLAPNHEVTRQYPSPIAARS